MTECFPNCQERFSLPTLREMWFRNKPMARSATTHQSPMGRRNVWTRSAVSVFQTIALVLAIACGLACALRGAEVDDAAASITADDLMRHIRTLASDEFEGRAPGTK